MDNIVLQLNGVNYEVEGFAQDDIIKINPRRKWWVETSYGYQLCLRDGRWAYITPKNKQDFFEKYLKNLEDSEVSPFGATE